LDIIDKCTENNILEKGIEENDADMIAELEGRATNMYLR
jgi:hypothetical protein